MTLYEQEKYIKDLVKLDRRNPEIYEKLQEMIYMFLRRKRIGRNPKEVQDISYTMAGDLYLRILEGEDIFNYLGLLDKEHRSYFEEYSSSRIFFEPYDVSLDPKLFNGEPPTYDFIKVDNKIYLEEIHKVINQVIEKSCKYKPWTPEYNNLKVSLALTLLRGEETYYHLSEECKHYLKFLVVSFYNEVRKTSYFDIGGGL